MKVLSVDPMPLHPLLCYPGTRIPLRAVGLRADGSPLWPLCGGDGEEEGDEDEGEDSESEEESDDEADDTEDTDDASTKKGKTKRTGPVSREDYERIQRQLSNADRRRTEAEKAAAALQKEKDEQERKGKPELENVKKDLETVTKERDSFQARFTNLARTNAFLTASAKAGITWHDPEDAQAAAGKDLRELEIDEDGNVEGIRELVKDLAKRKQYLVNKGKGDDEEDKEEKTSRRVTSGSGVGSTRTTKGKKQAGQFSDEELRKRFPALGGPR